MEPVIGALYILLDKILYVCQKSLCFQQSKVQIFFSNQSYATYKLLLNLGSQETPPKSINELTMTKIATYMKHQFDPNRFVVQERFKFWSEMQSEPGKSFAAFWTYSLSSVYVWP